VREVDGGGDDGGDEYERSASHRYLTTPNHRLARRLHDPGALDDLGRLSLSN
jgi:hypothetical protein